jgi:hypothetical protein
VSSSLRRGALAATVIAFSIAPLAACGVGNDSQTLEVKPDNAATTVGVIKVQNAAIITQPQLNAKGPAVISATLFNNGRTDQTLDSVTLAGTGTSAQLTPAKGSGPVTVPAGGSVLLGGKGHASAVLPSGREAVTDGNVQSVTFTFSRTGQVKLDTYVTPARSYFSKFGPSTIPTPSTAPSQNPSGNATPSASTSSSGSPSSSPSGAQGTGNGAQTGNGNKAGAQTKPSTSASASGH